MSAVKKSTFGTFYIRLEKLFLWSLTWSKEFSTLQELLGKFNGNKKAEKTTLWSVKIIREKLKEKEQQRKQNSV